MHVYITINRGSESFEYYILLYFKSLCLTYDKIAAGHHRLFTNLKKMERTISLSTCSENVKLKPRKIENSSQVLKLLPILVSGCSEKTP